MTELPKHQMHVEFLGADFDDPEQNDLIGVNMARASFEKQKDSFGSADRSLLRFLLRAKPTPHSAPLRHGTVRFRVRLPITVDRQFATHHIGVARSSASYRYVKADDYYVPNSWYRQAENVKQGSSNESFTRHEDQAALIDLWTTLCDQAFLTYEALVAFGLCRDQARMILPQAQMTTVSVTMSVWAFWNFFIQRFDAHAQKEIQWLAYHMAVHVNNAFPETFEALLRYRHGRTWKQVVAVWVDDTLPKKGWGSVVRRVLRRWIKHHTPTFENLSCVKI